MKNKLDKRILAVLLAASMTLSLAACGKDNSPAPSTADGSSAADTADKDPLGKYAEPVELTMFGSMDSNQKFADGETYEDNLWTKYYEDQLNIKISYKWIVNADQYPQKLAASIASKDIADIIHFEKTDKNMNVLAKAGQLQDLTQVYNDYATDLTKSILTEDGGTAMESGMVNKIQVAIPWTDSSIEAAQYLWIRQDWLDKSGKTAPKTMDELFELMKFFKDANYDNQPTVYGMAMDKKITTGMEGFFAGFGGHLRKWMDDGSGNLVYSSVQPEIKDGLAAMATLYKDGLIDPEFSVKDSDKIKEDLSTGRAGIFYGGHASPITHLSETMKNIDGADWVPYPAPTKDGSPVKQVVDINVTKYQTVSKDCKNSEALVKMMNLFTETCFGENADMLYYNSSDKYQEPFKMARVQAWPIDKNIQIQKRIEEGVTSGDMSIIENHAETKQNYELIKKYQDSGDPTGWMYDRIFGLTSSEKLLSGYLENDQLIYNKFYCAPTDTMSKKQSVLEDKEDEIFAQIVLGEMQPDSFDSFVTEWNSLGGEQITKEVNEWNKNK